MQTSTSHSSTACLIACLASCSSAFLHDLGFFTPPCCTLAVAVCVSSRKTSWIRCSATLLIQHEPYMSITDRRLMASRIAFRVPFRSRALPDFQLLVMAFLAAFLAASLAATPTAHGVVCVCEREECERCESGVRVRGVRACEEQGTGETRGNDSH